MIYLLTLQFKKLDKLSKQDFYYAVLGGFLSLFEDTKPVHKGILKLSFYFNDFFNIQISILGKENYDYIVNYLLGLKDKGISINGNKFELQSLNFDFRIFDTNNIEYKEFNSFELKFYSPTFIRKGDVNFYMPLPEIFLYSAFEKLDKIYGFEIDKTVFKDFLKYNIFVGEFDLKTIQVKIKGGIRAGIVGYAKYYIKQHENQDFVKLLNIVLKGILFVGIGSGINLGCGNVRAILNYNKN